MTKLDEFVQITEGNAEALEKRIKAEIDDRIYHVGLDVEVEIGEHERGDWTEAKHNCLPDVYKMCERTHDSHRLGFDQNNEECCDEIGAAPMQKIKQKIKKDLKRVRLQWYMKQRLKDQHSEIEQQINQLKTNIDTVKKKLDEKIVSVKDQHKNEIEAHSTHIAKNKDLIAINQYASE